MADDSSGGADVGAEQGGWADDADAAPEPISRFVDELEGYDGFHYGATPETLGKVFVAVQGWDHDDHHFDRVRLVMIDTERGSDRFVFGLCARRSAENPAVAKLSPVKIFDWDDVLDISIRYATDRFVGVKPD